MVVLVRRVDKGHFVPKGAGAIANSPKRTVLHSRCPRSPSWLQPLYWRPVRGSPPPTPIRTPHPAPTDENPESSPTRNDEPPTRGRRSPVAVIHFVVIRFVELSPYILISGFHGPRLVKLRVS